MKLILNLIPVLFLAILLGCAYGIAYSEFPLTVIVSLLPVTAGCFVSSLAWRMTPAGSVNRKINAVLFLAILVSGSFMYSDTSLVRVLWFPSVLLVFACIHLFFFTAAAKTTLFSGRAVLLSIPFLLSAFSLAGLWLWNGTLVLASIGLVAGAIFALLATLFGKPGEFTNRGEIRESQE